MNLSFCSFPKGGSTMIRQIIAHAAGLLTRTAEPATERTTLYLQQIKVGRNYTQPYSHGRCFYSHGRKLDAHLERAGFTSKRYSPGTTNVLIARDPYTRAVSQFHDQIARGYLRPDFSEAAFLNYVRNYSSHSSYQHHVGHAAQFCLGWEGARFDH